MRTISLEHYTIHIGPLFKKHNVLNIFDSFKLELGVFMYKYQTNLLPQTFSNYFIKHNQIRKYSTRNAEDYNVHKEKNVFRPIYTSNRTNFMEFIRYQKKTLQNH